MVPGDLSDVAGNVTARPDQQPFADDKFTVEAAMHIGIICRCVPAENAGRRDDHVLASFRQRCRDGALDYEAVARGDFAVKGHPRPDNHSSAINLITACSSLLCHRSLLEIPV